jgi:hypothetical protein
MTIASNESCGVTGPLEVHGENLWARNGQKLILPLWSNRDDADLHYEWRLIQAPEGSVQQVEQPSGDSTLTAPGCRQVYVDGRVPTFTADVPGNYVFQVRAVELSTGASALGEATLVVTSCQRSGPDGGCAVSPGLPVLLAGLIILRRLCR